MKKHFVFLILSFILFSCSKNETQIITKVLQTTNQGSWSIEQVVFSNILSDNWLEKFQIENIEESDKKNLKNISNSIYFLKWNDIYCLDFVRLIKLDWLNKSNLKWANNLFLYIWDDLYYTCTKVENWDINTLRYKKVWDEYIAAWDKNNLYIWFKEIFQWWDIDTYTKLGRWYSKDKNFVYLQPAMQTIKISWADSVSFELVNEYSDYAKDKNFVYGPSWEKLIWIDPRTFDLENYLKSKESLN